MTGPLTSGRRTAAGSNSPSRNGSSGSLTVEDGGIYDFLDTMLVNLQAKPAGHPVQRLRERLANVSRRLMQYNPAGRARRNVAHHYDLNGRLYSLFLDRDRQYCCAYFLRGY
jgi:cyclopropane-fatty-acyl-phospholipid synthase